MHKLLLSVNNQMIKLSKEQIIKVIFKMIIQ